MKPSLAIFSLVLFCIVSDVTPGWAHGQKSDEYQPGFEVSQAMYLAIDACKADGCDIQASQMIVAKNNEGIEVFFMGRTPTAKQLFSGDYEHVTERHYLVNSSGTAVLRKWYGK